MDDATLRSILEDARTVAVIGAHSDAARAAFYVPDYLHRQGYRVLPVNPTIAGERLFGQEVRARVQDLDEPVDLVDVFRRSAAVIDHVPEILAMHPRPRVVWLQLGIRNDAATKALEREGITVVQSRCTMAEHRRLSVKPHRG